MEGHLDDALPLLQAAADAAEQVKCEPAPPAVACAQQPMRCYEEVRASALRVASRRACRRRPRIDWTLRLRPPLAVAQRSAGRLAWGRLAWLWCVPLDEVSQIGPLGPIREAGGTAVCATAGSNSAKGCLACAYYHAVHSSPGDHRLMPWRAAQLMMMAPARPSAAHPTRR